MVQHTYRSMASPKNKAPHQCQHVVRRHCVQACFEVGAALCDAVARVDPHHLRQEAQLVRSRFATKLHDGKGLRVGGDEGCQLAAAVPPAQHTLQGVGIALQVLC